MAIGLAGKKIITQGLGVNYKACEGLITTQFSLYCVKIIVGGHGGGGGPYPGKAWNKFDNAMDIFQPVDKDIYDPEKVYREKKEITIRVEFGNFHMEKIYLIPINRANVIVKVLDLLNVTKSRIIVSINNMRLILHNIKISISGLRRK